ncbi:UNVERIFIED_CONTAM: hypothetical protein NCL1_29385 [Trichonephila clavipes]
MTLNENKFAKSKDSVNYLRYLHYFFSHIVDPSWLRTCVCHCFCRVVGSSPKLSSVVQQHQECCGSPVVKVSNHDRHVMSSSPVPLKTRRVGQRYMLNLSRAETSSSWCGVVVRRGGCQLRCRPCHLTMVQNDMVGRQKPSCS